MTTLKRLLYGLGFLAVSTLLALLMVAGYGVYQHVQQDHQNLHALVDIVSTNLHNGKLDLPPQPPPAPAPTASKAEAPKK